MAAQEWQQVLLSDPNNAEAMAGLAKDLKLMGSDKAGEALDRLRSAHPNDPNIARIEAMPSTVVASGQLRQAGELAQQGRLDDAMRIYRQLYGDHPPDGDIALAYYKTLYGTSTGKAEAIAGMRALADRNPGDARYAVNWALCSPMTSTPAPKAFASLRRIQPISMPRPACARRSSGTPRIPLRLPNCANFLRRIRRTRSSPAV